MTDVKLALRVHEMLRRLYADTRFQGMPQGGEVRALAAAAIWAASERIMARGGSREFGQRIADIVGAKDWHACMRIVAADAPRFEPPNYRGYYHTCPAPMIRRDGPCGQRTTSMPFRVTDPTTGQWERVAYCRRHAEEGERVRQLEWARQKAGGIPEPLPNVGGLLPCHTTINNWADLYMQSRYGRWTPPRVGIRADDWPVMARVQAAAQPRFTAIDGGCEMAAGEFTRPALQLITD